MAPWCISEPLWCWGVRPGPQIHERSIEADMVLACLRQMMRRHARFQLVLMSATLDSKRFKEYFADFEVDQVLARRSLVRVAQSYHTFVCFMSRVT